MLLHQTTQIELAYATLRRTEDSLAKEREEREKLQDEAKQTELRQEHKLSLSLQANLSEDMKILSQERKLEVCVNFPFHSIFPTSYNRVTFLLHRLSDFELVTMISKQNWQYPSWIMNF